MSLEIPNPELTTSPYEPSEFARRIAELRSQMYEEMRQALEPDPSESFQTGLTPSKKP